MGPGAPALAVVLLAAWPPCAPGAARCGARVLKRGDKLKARLVEPVLARRDVSSARARQRGWDRAGLLEDYGELVCPIYARHLWDELRPYPKCRAFVEGLAQGGAEGSGAALPPLTLSFNGGYQGAEAMQAQLRRDVALPGWATRLLGSDERQTQWTLSFGPNGTGIQMHGTHPRTVVAVLEGRKRWLLLPPDALERLRQAAGPGDPALYWQLGPGQLLPGRSWDEGLWQRALREVPGAVECVQEAGTVLAVPDYWGHATVNEGDCVAVGVQARQAAGSGPAAGGAGAAAPGLRAQLLARVRGAVEQGEGARAALRSELRGVLAYDPVQSLRDHFDTQGLWRLLSGAPEGLGELRAAAARVTEWLREQARSRRLSPEHALSAAVAVFPFDARRGPNAELPAETRRLALALLGAALEFWALPFEGPFRADAAPFAAAMAAELGDDANASMLLSAHLAHSAARGDFVAARGAGAGGAWRRCAVYDAGDPERLALACFAAAAGPGPAVVAASGELRGEPREGAPGVGRLPLGQQVVVEEVRGGWARVTAPARGWVPLWDAGGQVVLGVADVGNLQYVPRASGRIGWRAGVPLRSVAARLAAEWSPRLAALARSPLADPTFAAATSPGRPPPRAAVEL